MNLNEIPFVDLDKKNDLEFHLQSTLSSSDYDNSRDRPYNGQSWTDEGLRGQTEVKGLTMRDIKDCLIKAMLVSYVEEEYVKEEEFKKCWDFSKYVKEGDEIPTQYLLDKQKEGKYLCTKVQCGNWRPQDIFNIDFTKVSPLAIAQNLTVEIEKMMGIFPNISEE